MCIYDNGEVLAKSNTEIGNLETHPKTQRNAVRLRTPILW